MRLGVVYWFLCNRCRSQNDHNIQQHLHLTPKPLCLFQVSSCAPVTLRLVGNDLPSHGTFSTMRSNNCASLFVSIALSACAFNVRLCGNWNCEDILANKTPFFR